MILYLGIYDIVSMYIYLQTRLHLFICVGIYIHNIYMCVCRTLWIMYRCLRASLPNVPLGCWYHSGTKHFHPTILVGWKRKSQLRWVIKPVPHNIVQRIRFWKIKSSEHDLKYLYWTFRKLFSEIYLPVSENKSLIGERWGAGVEYH